MYAVFSLKMLNIKLQVVLGWKLQRVPKSKKVAFLGKSLSCSSALRGYGLMSASSRKAIVMKQSAGTSIPQNKEIVSQYHKIT